MKRSLIALSAAFCLSVGTVASAETFAIDVKFHGELPFFGMTADNLAWIVGEELRRAGHQVADNGGKDMPTIVVEYSGWSTKMDGGQTLMGKAEGVVALRRPYQVVASKGKTQTMYLIPAFRICNGLATDDRRGSLQEGFRKCASNFINN